MGPGWGATLHQGGWSRTDGRYVLLVFGLGSERWTHDVARGSEVFPEYFMLLVLAVREWWVYLFWWSWPRRGPITVSKFSISCVPVLVKLYKSGGVE